MKTVPLPPHWLRVGRRVPVDVRDASGRLLMARNHLLETTQQRDALLAQHATLTETDASAWQRAFQREVQHYLQQGGALLGLRELPMPEGLADTDYVEAQPLSGGWPDVLDALRTLLDQGEHGLAPLARLRGLEVCLQELLRKDVDRALFELMQALVDTQTPSCASHALLCGVLAHLCADKLDWPEELRNTVTRAALLMNLGMARQYDMLARQKQPPDDAQRAIIRDHAALSVQRAQVMGLDHEAVLALMRWHHQDPPQPLPEALQPALELLRVVDRLVARLAARATRRAMTALYAVRELVLDVMQPGQRVGAALATVLGFYPPGSYVQLADGETAVVLARGARAHQPLVASIVDGQGLALARALVHDTAEAGYAVQAAVDARRIQVRLPAEKAMALRAAFGRVSSTSPGER